MDPAQRVITAADCYQAMTSERPYRQALTADRAATELRAMSVDGRLDGYAVEEVLVAAGHRRAARPSHPAGLSDRGGGGAQAPGSGPDHRPGRQKPGHLHQDR